jgi:hypothetical protein
MNQPTTIKTASSGLTRPRMLMLGSLLAVATVTALLAAQAQAQAPEPAAAPAATPAATPASPTVTYYDPKDLERAFKFMDKTGDGKVSRDEASNFRGVSKHFDEADVNKDGFLSREEFDNAMNRSKQP